jgi:GNAT superfamily N-acetyltransferase
VHFEPITPALYESYINIGTLAYNQHYQHLWPNGETSTYIKNSFTQEVLLKEELDKNTALFLIKTNDNFSGILKITMDKAIARYCKQESLYLDKIYILKEHTGMGIGRKTLEFVSEKAKSLDKKVIYLEAMQKGPALGFYQKNGFNIINTTQVPFKNVIEKEKPMYILLKEI